MNVERKGREGRKRKLLGFPACACHFLTMVLSGLGESHEVLTDGCAINRGGRCGIGFFTLTKPAVMLKV